MPSSSSDSLSSFDQRRARDGDFLALLIVVFDLGDHEGHLAAATALALVNVGDFGGAGQYIADQDRLVELEFLLAVQNPAEVEIRHGYRATVLPEGCDL